LNIFLKFNTDSPYDAIHKPTEGGIKAGFSI